jgi:hypothetical protein
VGGGQPGPDDGLDLPPELGLHLLDPRLREQVGDVVRSVQGSGGIQQGADGARLARRTPAPAG